MARPTLHIDDDALNAWCSSQEVLDALRPNAEIYGERVGASVHSRTGRFADSIEVEEEDHEGVRRLVVASTDPIAHIIEFGSANSPAQAPFRRAAAALGLDYSVDPR